jgi:hypothetical protein
MTHISEGHRLRRQDAIRLPFSLSSCLYDVFNEEEANLLAFGINSAVAIERL